MSQVQLAVVALPRQGAMLAGQNSAATAAEDDYFLGDAMFEEYTYEQKMPPETTSSLSLTLPIAVRQGRTSVAAVHCDGGINCARQAESDRLSDTATDSAGDVSDEDKDKVASSFQERPKVPFLHRERECYVYFPEFDGDLPAGEELKSTASRSNPRKRTVIATRPQIQEPLQERGTSIKGVASEGLLFEMDL